MLKGLRFFFSLSAHWLSAEQGDKHDENNIHHSEDVYGGRSTQNPSRPALGFWAEVKEVPGLRRGKNSNTKESAQIVLWFTCTKRKGKGTRFCEEELRQMLRFGFEIHSQRREARSYRRPDTCIGSFLLGFHAPKRWKDRFSNQGYACEEHDWPRQLHDKADFWISERWRNRTHLP